MATSSLRGARSAAAPLVLALGAVVALTGCSSSHKTAATSSPPTSTPRATATADPQAAQLLARAATTLAAEKSYRFDATETVAAKTPVTTRLTGAVVRGNGVSYALTVGRTTTQVVRIKAATYVRKAPGRWARLGKPRAVADPTASLAALLHGLSGARVASAGSGTGTTVVGTLPAAAARTAGIPTASEPAQVTVAVDPSGHVTRVTVHTSTQAGSTAVTVTLVTSYFAFDRVPALRRPV